MRTVKFVLGCLLIVVGLAPGTSSEAQGTTPPWPDGCSVRLPLFVQNGLDRIFFGACNRHDLCWARCNTQFGPYLGVGHKASCDFSFAIEMEAACAAWSVILSYPGSGWIDSGEFLEACSAVAGTFAAAVNTPLGFGVFWRSQCARGCNPDACAISPPWNPLCGLSQCYVYAPLPSPNDPPEPDDPCINPDSSLQSLSVAGDPLLFQEIPESNYPLLRKDVRDGFTYRMEEWALLAIEVAPNGRVVQVQTQIASTGAYGTFQRRALIASAKRDQDHGRKSWRPGRSIVLAVHQPPHQHDERWIPIPQPVLNPIPLPSGTSTGRAVLRVDIAEDRSLIGFEVLYSSRPLSDGEDIALRDALELQYASEKPHRVVLFAVVTLGDEIALENSLVVLPRCCPNDDPAEL